MCLIGTHLVHVLHVVGRGDGVVPRAGDDQLAEGGNHGLEGPGHPGPAEALGAGDRLDGHGKGDPPLGLLGGLPVKVPLVIW